MKLKSKCFEIISIYCNIFYKDGNSISFEDVEKGLKHYELRYDLVESIGFVLELKSKDEDFYISRNYEYKNRDSIDYIYNDLKRNINLLDLKNTMKSNLKKKNKK